MKFAITLALISVVGMIFGWWGNETPSGESYFDDEMSSVPILVGIASIFGFLIAVIVYSIAAKVMNIFAIVLALISICGLIFSWWGLETITGRGYFVEMAGIIPAFAGIASAIGLTVAGVIYYFARR